MARLTPHQREDARQTFRDHGQCQDCGGIHARACPRIKKIRTEWSPAAGAQLQQLIRRDVEYFPPGSWPSEEIIWPEDAYEDDEETDEGKAIAKRE